MSLTTHIRDFARSRIFLRQFGTNFLLMVGFTLLFSAAIWLRTSEEFKVRQVVIAEHLRNQNEAAIREWLYSRVNAVKAFAVMFEGETVAALTTTATAKKLAALVAAHPDFVDIILIDGRGFVINSASSRAEYQSLDLADREYFREAADTGVGVTGFMPGKRIKRPTMTVAARIAAADGSSAVAAAFITPNRFRTMMDELNHGGPGAAYLVDKDGASLLPRTADAGAAQAADTEAERTPAAAAAARGERGATAYRTSAGEQAVGAYVWIEEIQAGLVVELGGELLMRPLERLQGFVFIVAVAWVLLALVASAALSARIFEPERELIRAMDEVAATD